MIRKRLVVVLFDLLEHSLIVIQILVHLSDVQLLSLGWLLGALSLKRQLLRHALVVLLVSIVKKLGSSHESLAHICAFEDVLN